MASGVDGGKRLEGVGGWLLTFVILQLVALAFAMYSAGQGDDLRAGLEGPLLDPELGFVAMIGFEVKFHLVRTFGILLGFVLMAMRNRVTPVYWQLFLLATIVGLIVDIVLGQRLVSNVKPLITAAALAQVKAQMLRETVRAAGAILGSVLWILYWQSSERVANTYRGGGEEAMIASPGDFGEHAPAFIPQVHPGAPQERGFGDRPTRDCPSCGTENLLAAHYCRGCRAELAPAEGPA